MATATATKSPQPHPKIKRPPPPSIQTTINGVNSFNASPSSSLGTKRPPSGYKHPPTSASATGNPINGVGSRVSSRQRRESQRPGESSGRPMRTSGRGQSVDMVEGEKLKYLTKRPPEPYGTSTLNYRIKIIADNDCHSAKHSAYSEQVQRSGTISYHPSTSYAF